MLYIQQSVPLGIMEIRPSCEMEASLQIVNCALDDELAELLPPEA